MEWTFPAAAPLRADLELPSGSIDVTLAPTEEIRVSLEPVGAMTEKAREQIESARVTFDGQHLVVEIPKLRLRDVPLRLTVLLPPQSTLTCSTASADITTTGVVGPFGARTASGDVLFDGVCDLCDVTTASGVVRLGDVLGEGRVKTASGDIVVASIGGRAAIDTASGDVQVGQAASDVRVRTASGDIRLSHVSQGHLSVNSASGDVIIGVAQGVGTWLDIITVSGSTKCTLPTESSGEAEAALRISCRTVSGDVRIDTGDIPTSLSQRWA